MVNIMMNEYLMGRAATNAMSRGNTFTDSKPLRLTEQFEKHFFYCHQASYKLFFYKYTLIHY